MKIKILLSFILIIIFAITGVAFAMPKIDVLSPISEPVIMFFFGMFLTGASYYGRKLYDEQIIDRNR